MAATTTTNTKVRTFNGPRFPEDFWEWLLLQKDFRVAVTKQGFYELEKIKVAAVFKDWCDEQRHRDYELKIKPREYRIPSFSADFHSQIPRMLDSNDLYLLPTGGGNCAIFDSDVFPLPYLGLNGLDSDAAKLPVRTKNGFRNLVDSLYAHWNEQSFLRALHFCGAFANVVKKICDVDRYECGPSGHIASCFPFWMKDARRNKLVKFVYDGIADLDECLYPKDIDVVIPIEAKIYCGHTDLSWHKLAFPAYRFIDNSRAMRTFRTGSSVRGIYNSKVRIVPVYCLYNPIIKRAYIYVFPKITTIRCFNYDCPEYGVVLNDHNQMIPKNVFEVPMDWL